ncbi:MAG TPA: YetF domain-containing protein [Lacunisphaera sp.]
MPLFTGFLERQIVDELIGLSTPAANLTLLQMSVRSFIVFAWGIVLVRTGDRRLLGPNAGFDMLLVIILGSVLSRAVNGQAAFFPTLGVSGLLVLMHHALARCTSKSKWFSRLTKGEALPLISHGRVDRRALERAQITDDDLRENLRLNGNVTQFSDVAEAQLERNGVVSVIPKKP